MSDAACQFCDDPQGGTVPVEPFAQGDQQAVVACGRCFLGGVPVHWLKDEYDAPDDYREYPDE